MPRVVIRGMKKEDVREISVDLLGKIESIINRPKDAFTLESVSSHSYFDGKELSQVYVEVSWKSRPVEVCKEVAEAIQKIIKKQNYDKVYVYFKDLDLEKEFLF